MSVGQPVSEIRWLGVHVQGWECRWSVLWKLLVEAERETVACMIPLKAGHLGAPRTKSLQRIFPGETQMGCAVVSNAGRECQPELHILMESTLGMRVGMDM